MYFEICVCAKVNICKFMTEISVTGHFLNSYLWLIYCFICSYLTFSIVFS